MPTETMTKNERVVPEVLPEVVPETLPETVRAREDESLRKIAVKHLEDVRKFKLWASGYVLALLVLTPVWIATEYASTDGWPERLSSQGNPGDWDPWIFWVALVGAVIVGIHALKAYFWRPPTEVEIDREIERLRESR